MISRTFPALAALSLATAATAQSAQPLSLAGSPVLQRDGAEVQHDSQFLRRSGWILGIVALGILVFIVLEANKDHPLPGSP
jgi:hypothetical protein